MATTIQSLIQSAAPGTAVIVPPGTYDVSGLDLGNITLQASGSVTLTGNLTVSGPQTVVSGFTFSGGTVDISNSTGATIQNCAFNGGQTSINLDGAHSASIINNVFHDVGASVVTGWGLDQSTISGNKFYDCYQAIDLLFDNNHTQGRDITIADNYFTGTQRMPIEVGPTDAYTSNLVVKGNWSENMNNVGIQDGYSTDVAYSIVPTNGVNTLIQGNYAMGPGGGVGIELAGSGEVTGNYVDSFWYGVIVYGSGFKVHDNALVNQSIETVLNYSGGSGTIQNNQTTAAGFAMPHMPGTNAPPVVAAALQHDTGSSASDHITSNPALAGTADPNAVVHFTVDGVGIATTATADSTGKWTFTPTGLADGSHKVVASETNSAGTGSASVSFTLDARAPVVTEKLASSSTSGIPVVTGTGDPNATVHFSVDGKAIAGTAMANSSGVWSYTLNGLAAGQHTVVASEKDLAGNIGKASTTVTVAAPVVTAALLRDTGASATDHVTSNPALTGKADPNAVIHFTVDGKAITATATANSTGTWSFTPTGLSDGSHTVVATETNLVGTGKTSLSFTLDKTAPAVTETPVSKTASGDLVLIGKGDLNAIVHFTVDGHAIAATAVANSSGDWSYAPTGLTAGQHTVVASETDLAGNTGNASATITVAPPPALLSGTTSPTTNDGSVVARDDTYKIDSGASLWVASRYLTWNDSGPDGSGKNGGLTVTDVDAKSVHGFDISFKDGTLVYKPDAGWNGTDSFNYTVKDAGGHADTALVVVTVGTGVTTSTSPSPTTLTTANSSTSPVIATDDNYKLDAGKTLYFNSRYLTANDKGTDLKVTSVDAVSDHGIHVSWGPEGSQADGTTIYKAAADFHGDDHFNYAVSDANGHTDVGTIWIHIA